jgi:hypothetical protein
LRASVRQASETGIYSVSYFAYYNAFKAVATSSNQLTAVQDAFGEPGTNPSLGVNEITAFNAIGYQVVVPEPSTLALAGLGLALGCCFVRRRRTAA